MLIGVPRSNADRQLPLLRDIGTGFVSFGASRARPSGRRRGGGHHQVRDRCLRPGTGCPSTTTVYDSINSPMPPNVPSLGFQATQTSAFGDRVQLSPGARRLTSFTVMMSSWGCETGGGATCSTTPGATFDHPLTLTLYDSAPGTATGIGTQVLTQTTTFSIPFRPSRDATCAGGTAWRASDNNCYNGFATPVTFDFPALPTIPTNLVWTMSYNTSNYGPSPIGPTCTNNCAYDSLNVGLSTLPSTIAGVDLDPTSAVANSANSGTNCAGGAGLRARDRMLERASTDGSDQHARRIGGGRRPRW